MKQKKSKSRKSALKNTHFNRSDMKSWIKKEVGKADGKEVIN